MVGLGATVGAKAGSALAGEAGQSTTSGDGGL
jgi:hypothetical protein